MNEIRIIQPIANHNFDADNRVLIPFRQYHKFGFMDHSQNVVVPAKYDFIIGDFDESNSLVRVGEACGRGYTRSNGDVQVYLNKSWGVLDSTGTLIVNCEYESILISDDQQFITLQHREKGYTLIDRNGNTIIPYGVYSYMDGADQGLVRVKTGNGSNINLCNECKWGIVDTTGRILLPIQYSSIWNFYGKNRRSTRVEIDGHSEIIAFDSLIRVDNTIDSGECESYEEYGTHYGEFEGSYAQDVMGYSDDVINDAFEGDPDAYWNID